MRKLKVGIMLRHVGERGGVQVVTMQVVRYLLTQAQHFSFHLLYRHASQQEPFAGLDAEHVVLPARSKLLWDQWAVPRYARQAGLDVVLNAKFSVPFHCAARTVSLVPGAELWEVPQAFPWYDRWYNYVVLPLLLRRASAIVTYSQHGKDDLVRHTGVDPCRIHVVPLAASPWLWPASAEDQAAARAKHGLPRRYVLFVGGITPLKNLDNLVRAFALIASDYDVDLVVAGFRRRAYQDVSRVIDEMGLHSRVHEVGFVPDADMAAVYSAAECFVFPSWYEGFGIPVIEAMACGCPVVVSAAGCLPEVAGGAAVLVDPAQPASIADGIRQLLDDARLRRLYIERGMQRAAALSWDETGARIAQVAGALAADGQR